MWIAWVFLEDDTSSRFSIFKRIMESLYLSFGHFVVLGLVASFIFQNCNCLSAPFRYQLLYFVVMFLCLSLVVVNIYLGSFASMISYMALCIIFHLWPPSSPFPLPCYFSLWILMHVLLIFYSAVSIYYEFWFISNLYAQNK